MIQRRIESLLPEVFQRAAQPGSPLSALTAAMEALHAPDETVLETIAAVFSPRTTPDRFVEFLSRWVEMGRLLDDEGPSGLRSARESRRPGLPPGRLRELTAVAAHCSRIRGTREGLLLMLRTATGCQDFTITENEDAAGRPRLFHIVVTAPALLAESRALIERILQSEKPACTTCELVFRPENPSAANP